MDSIIRYLEGIQKKLTAQTLMVQVVGKDRSLLNLIVTLNTEDQLFKKGEDALGNEITPEYTPFTVELKQAKGQPTDRVTLKDTGDFYKSFLAHVDNSGDIIISADPIKIDEQTGLETNLTIKYGREIIGLNQHSLDILNEKIILPAQKYIKEKIFKV